MALPAIKNFPEYESIQNNLRNISKYQEEVNNGRVNPLRSQILNTMGVIINTIKKIGCDVTDLVNVKNAFMPVHTMFSQALLQSDQETLEDIAFRQDEIIKRFNEIVDEIINTKDVPQDDMEIPEKVKRGVMQVVKPKLVLEIHNGMGIIINGLREYATYDISELKRIMAAFILEFNRDRKSPQLPKIRNAFLKELMLKDKAINEFVRSIMK